MPYLEDPLFGRWKIQCPNKVRPNKVRYKVHLDQSSKSNTKLSLELQPSASALTHVTPRLWLKIDFPL